LSCPANQELVATSEQGATITYPAVQATDAVSLVTLSYSRPSGTVLPVGETAVTLKATDAAGNSTSCSFTVNVLPSTQQPEPDSGCGCRTFNAAQAPWWLLLSLATLLVRRRRGDTASLR
jgi:MYXO-CTERM domain-containing protein